MDTRNGFILGIFNYCDSWCRMCPLTSRCAVFADQAEMEAALDPNLRAVVDAPPLPEEAPPLPDWLEELAEMEEEASAEEPLADETASSAPEEAGEHAAVEWQARAYTTASGAWLQAQGDFSAETSDDPRAVIDWYHTLIPAKLKRALNGLAFEEEPAGRRDCDGSAKVALLAIDRSVRAWLEAGTRGYAGPSDVAHFTAELESLTEAIEQIFPMARAFVRPGFDEPDAVARLEQSERE